MKTKPHKTMKCNCLCHFKRKPTPEEFAVSSYYGCKHCQKPIKAEQGWEKEFEKMFVSEWTAVDGTDRRLWNIQAPSPNRVIKFIRKTLASERSRMIKELTDWAIKEELPDTTCHISHHELVGGYNQALLKLRQHLTKLKGGNHEEK